MTELALVGCAHIHTPGFVKRVNNRRDVRIKLVWDHDIDRAQANAEELEATVVRDINQIWEDDTIPAVVICTETNIHEEFVLAACKAGKDLFVEKPLGFATADAQRMARAIDEAGSVFQTGYFKRGDPHNQFLRQAIQAGHFGKITRIKLSNGHSGSLGDWFSQNWAWMTDPSVAGTGAFGDLGTHVLDLLLWLLDPIGAKVSAVTASLGTALARYGETCDEYGEGIIRFEDGIIGTIAAGWVDLADPVKLIISGTEGHAYIVKNELFFKSDHVDGADGESPWTDLPVAWPHAFELFLDAVVKADPPAGQNSIPLVTPQEAVRRNAVMEAMYQGAEGKAWVRPIGE